MGLTDFRLAVSEQLSQELGFEIKPGMLVGPVSRQLGSCYVQRVSEVSGRVQEEELLVIIRLFQPFEQQIEPETPYDPAPLESLVEQLQAFVAGHQTGLGAWFQRLVSCEIDVGVQGVEAILVGRDFNASTTW